MAVSFKALALTGTLVVGGIAIPVYLRNSGQSVDSSLNELKQLASSETSGRSSPDTEPVEPIEKLSCNVSDLSDTSKNEAKFLQGRKGEANLYRLVSCNNVKVEGEDTSLLGKNWSGLFPKNVLNEKLAINSEGKFEINAKSANEDGDFGTVTVFTFSNPLNESSLRARREELVDTDFKKGAFVLLAEGVSQTPKNIYIFINWPPQDTSDGVD